jgi:hypothetical protein
MKRFGFIALATLATTLSVSVAYSVMGRPPEANVQFAESDFEAKPWLKDFQWVVVVNRANSGADRQSARIYHHQQLLQYDEVAAYLSAVSQGEQASGSNDPNLRDRSARISELSRKMWAPGVFKISTGRNAYESAGEHHSQHDSWSVTPTGFFVPQSFQAKHKSESYSSKMCDSFAGKLISALTRKVLCTYMENVTFFNGGIGLHKAIPGTESALGSKASGGCVRMPAALAEFLFLNFQEAKGDAVPIVEPDGSVKLDANGNVTTEKVHRGEWGSLEARSVLIIIEDESEIGGVNYVAPFAQPALISDGAVKPAAEVAH